VNELKEQNFISAVVYVHNDENNLKEFLNVVDDFLKENFLSYEIICVNDGSNDKSAEITEEFSKNCGGKITILNMSYYQGRECSMHAGVDLAIGDYVYEFETVILSYPIDILRKIYDECLNGCDIVSAYPKSSGHPLSDIFYGLYNSFSGSVYKLKTEAVRILSRRAINRVASMSDTIPYRKAAYANCGLKIGSICYKRLKPIPCSGFKERRMRIKTAEDALILYTGIAYKFSMSLVLVIGLITILTALYTCWIFYTGKPVRGWTTTMLFLSFGFFAMTSLLSIIIKYVSLILKIVFKKQKYIVESINKLK